MNNEQTVKNIELKLAYAMRLYNKMEGSKVDDDLLTIQDNFISFLSAFQQCFYYYSNLITSLFPTLSSNSKSEINKRIIEKWKTDELNSDEIKSWNVLNKLRNQDTHVKPIQAENVEINYLLTDENDNYIVTEDGIGLIVDSAIKYYVPFEEDDYNVFELAQCGISALEKLIVFIPTITINS